MILDIIAAIIVFGAIAIVYLLYQNYKMTIEVIRLERHNARLMEELESNQRDHAQVYDAMTSWCQKLVEEIKRFEEQYGVNSKVRNDDDFFY